MGEIAGKVREPLARLEAGAIELAVDRHPQAAPERQNGQNRHQDGDHNGKGRERPRRSAHHQPRHGPSDREPGQGGHTHEELKEKDGEKPAEPHRLPGGHGIRHGRRRNPGRKNKEGQLNYARRIPSQQPRHALAYGQLPEIGGGQQAERGDKPQRGVPPRLVRGTLMTGGERKRPNARCSRNRDQHHIVGDGK